MKKHKYIIEQNLHKIIETAIDKIRDENIITRIWDKDFTVWSISPEEISNRLGWLDCPVDSRIYVDEINEFVEEVIDAKFKKVLLLGMGGSSLAPEVFRLTFGRQPGYLELGVLDSTHPETVLEFSKRFNTEETLFIVSTKSGGTIETISLMKYFFNLAGKKIGWEKAGEHFTAITDPGSGLQKIAEELKFRKIFLNNPEIGGRFSSLSLFGLVPAALIGLDINLLLDSAKYAAEDCKNNVDLHKNTNEGALLGGIMGSLYLSGKDKLTFLLSDKLQHFGIWIEQLIAESTGKNGKGILPVIGEPVGSIEHYQNDRIFVEIKLTEEPENEHLTKISEAGFPVVKISLNNIYELAGEMFYWEFATAVSSNIIGIHPFDQPDVESAKIRAREMIKAYKADGELPKIELAFSDNDIKVYGDIKSKKINEALEEFLSIGNKNSYVSIQAFVNPTEEIDYILQKFRSVIFNKYNKAATLGYGPRFLHSTGQLHKGDNGNGLFIQIVDDHKTDAAIPNDALGNESEFSFSVLVNAQSLGDRQALIDNNRRVLRFVLSDKSEISDLVNKI